MKPLAPLALALGLVIAAATAALAHVDSLGQPDPYWQQVAATAAAGDAEAPPDATAPLQDLVSSGGLSLLLLVLGAALAFDVATAPGRRKPTADRSAGTMGEAVVRTVAGLPPSASGETRHVLRAAAAIAVAALVVSGLHASERGSDRAPQARAPFQTPFRDATPIVQRMFREIEAGLPAAENLRVATTRWPAVETLAAQGIPPFPSADSPYRWQLIQDGASTAYVGAPAPGSDAPALLALIQEPAPGSADAALPAPPPGELQHRLSDGTPLRVSIWFRPDGLAAADRATSAMLARPFAAGWKQVLGENQGS